MNELLIERLGQLEFERLNLIALLKEKDSQIDRLQSELDELKSTEK